MLSATRRDFMTCVSKGMLVAGLGSTLSNDLGFSTAFANEGSDALSFGKYDRLVDLLQSTPAEKMQPIIVEKIKCGEADLRTLISAAALANAETFGGQDYVGFHTAMAMLPALSMAELLPIEKQPLPVLKVLYRNCQQIQELGGASKKTLIALHEAEHSTPEHVEIQIRDASRKGDMNKAEALFATQEKASLESQFNALQPAVYDDINVHRFVFAHRTYGLAKLLGTDFAYTMLRQCVRFCVDNEQNRIERKYAESPIRTVLPKVLDQYKLEGKALGKRDPGDEWLDKTSQAIYTGPPARSAEIAAAALADGIDPEAVGEAIMMASNLLVLRQGSDNWRCHGDSAGVHSSDATNAFRNMARVVEPRHAIAGLIVAAYHSAAHKPFPGGAYPTSEHRSKVTASNPAGLLDELEDAVKHNDQGRAAAAIAIYGEHGFDAQPVFDRVLKYTISEDGRLHGEKYFHTVVEEFKIARPAFKWRQLVGLARVTASAYGYDRFDKKGFHAPGYEEACKLLGTTA